MTLAVRMGAFFLKLRRITCRVLTVGSEFANPLLAGRSPERTIEAALETDLRRWFEQPDAGSFETFLEACEVLLCRRYRCGAWRQRACECRFRAAVWCRPHVGATRFPASHDVLECVGNVQAVTSTDNRAYAATVRLTAR